MQELTELKAENQKQKETITYLTELLKRNAENNVKKPESNEIAVLNEKIEKLTQQQQLFQQQFLLLQQQFLAVMQLPRNSKTLEQAVQTDVPILTHQETQTSEIQQTENSTQTENEISHSESEKAAARKDTEKLEADPETDNQETGVYYFFKH